MAKLAPTSAASVANEFLDLQSGDPGYPLIDQMKLQKLVFYAQGWHLGLKDQALFDEDIFAWPWGPVVPALYHEFKEFGRNPIFGKKASTVTKTGPNYLDWRFVIPTIQDVGLKDFLKQVWDVHKGFTGIQLSNATHNPGEPWTIIKDQYGTLDSKPVIPPELMASVFAQKAGRVQNNPA